MEQPIKVFRKGNRELRIYQDDSCESPREWDNLGNMICFHKRYDLGDKHDLKSENFRSWEHIEKYLRQKAVVILPLYLYDHSGISMSTNRNYPFNCPWDSGQVGFIYCTEKDLKREKIDKKKAEQILQGEVDTYNQFLMGDIYGYQLVKIKSCKECKTKLEEVEDSCWGFYGYDFDKNGLFENSGIDIKKWKEM
jgi:hypothetical protein